MRHLSELSAWVPWLYGGTALFFVAMAATACRHLRWVRRLPLLEGAGASRIRCSVVIAARDEAARIETTLRRLLAQREIEMELIVVDDRSQDGTGKILERLAREDSRLKPHRVDTLPEGWLGKCHACHVGASQATGDWILFTDGDCWLQPDAIERAVRVAESERADHVTLSPATRVQGWAIGAWHLLFLTSLVNWFSGVNRDKPRNYLGFGAFNLVRTAAYRECGGYQALRLAVVDDVQLGLLLARAGKRTRAFLGIGEVECDWGSSLLDLVKVMEKNYFAMLNFQTGLVLAGLAFSTAVLCILVSGLLSATAVGLAAALSPLALIVPAAALARRSGSPWYCALGTPLMIPVFVLALINSTWMTLRQGGIRWRDTFYSLETLRLGCIRLTGKLPGD